LARRCLRYPGSADQELRLRRGGLARRGAPTPSGGRDGRRSCGHRRLRQRRRLCVPVLSPLRRSSSGERRGNTSSLGWAELPPCATCGSSGCERRERWRPGEQIPMLSAARGAGPSLARGGLRPVFRLSRNATRPSPIRAREYRTLQSPYRGCGCRRPRAERSIATRRPPPP
jgi:hypothetical protein